MFRLREFVRSACLVGAFDIRIPRRGGFETGGTLCCEMTLVISITASDLRGIKR